MFRCRSSGARVLVPLGTRFVTGIVVSNATDARPTPYTRRREASAERCRNKASSAKRGGGIKPIKQLIDSEAFVPRETVELAQWTAEYLRGWRRRRHPAAPAADGAWRTCRRAQDPPSRIDHRRRARSPRRGDCETTRRARDSWRARPTASAPPTSRHATFHGRSRVASGTGAGMPGCGRIASIAIRSAASAPARRRRRARTRRRGRSTGEQEAALRRLRSLSDAGQFKVALLHGVTGSGKTEMYLRLAAATRESGRRSLMLVPEIALTPAIATQFRDAFGDRVAIQHSGLSDGERHDQWQRIRRGEVDIVVGTRSAVFAPLERARVDRGGRGARRLLQTGGEPALQRA